MQVAYIIMRITMCDKELVEVHKSTTQFCQDGYLSLRTLTFESAPVSAVVLRVQSFRVYFHPRLKNLSPPRPLTPPVVAIRPFRSSSFSCISTAVGAPETHQSADDRSIHNGCFFFLFSCPAQTHGLDFSHLRCAPGLPGSCGACICQAPRGEEAD